MIRYFKYNGSGGKQASFEDVRGRIVLISDGSRLGLAGTVFLVTEDAGRAVTAMEIERNYDDGLKRFIYSQNKELGDRRQIDRSAIRVACDTVAEVDAVREVVRVMEKNIWEEAKAGEARLRALVGASVNASGPVVLEAGPAKGEQVCRWIDNTTGETVHTFKEA